MIMKHFFEANNKPFFPLGGQLHNSSAYNTEEMEQGWKALKLLKANTAEIPVYWEQLEPEKGKFKFSMVDIILNGARDNDLKLILLWFGTWKNGTMKFVPGWVKTKPELYKRVTTHDGLTVPILSSHCKATWEADTKAFCALMEYIRQNDENHRTVIAVQVQNEPGILGGTVRDYGEAAEKAFNEIVPADFVEIINKNRNSPIYRVWLANGAKMSGTWRELFGEDADEFFTACDIARYIDTMAASGKSIYNIPMYANVWLDNQGWNIPGLSYPSGGAVSKTLDIWKWNCKSIDLIAPDIYKTDSRSYCETCSTYDREDNLLFIPESVMHESNSRNMFYALANYNTIGFHTFGIENILAADGELRQEAYALVGSFQAVSAAVPLIIKYRGTDNIHAVVQEEGMFEQFIEMGDYIALIRFAEGYSDYHHLQQNPDKGSEPDRGRGLVFQTGEREFYILGSGFRLFLNKKNACKSMLSVCKIAENIQARLIDYLSVDEGYFDKDESWIVTRKRSGDESDYGIWVKPDTGAVRVVMAD